jgi:hypothetical protein
MFHQADVVMVETEAEEMHFLLGKPHRGAAVGMVQRGELQIEEPHIEILRFAEVFDVDHMMLQLGCACLVRSDRGCH